LDPGQQLGLPGGTTGNPRNFLNGGRPGRLEGKLFGPNWEGKNFLGLAGKPPGGLGRDGPAFPGVVNFPFYPGTKIDGYLDE